MRLNICFIYVFLIVAGSFPIASFAQKYYESEKETRHTYKALTGWCAKLAERKPGKACPADTKKALLVFDPWMWQKNGELENDETVLGRLAPPDSDCRMLEIKLKKEGFCIEAIAAEHANVLSDLLRNDDSLRGRYQFVSNDSHGSEGYWHYRSACESAAVASCRQRNLKTVHQLETCVEEFTSSPANAKVCPCFDSYGRVEKIHEEANQTIVARMREAQAEIALLKAKKDHPTTQPTETSEAATPAESKAASEPAASQPASAPADVGPTESPTESIDEQISRLKKEKSTDITRAAIHEFAVKLKAAEKELNACREKNKSQYQSTLSPKDITDLLAPRTDDQDPTLYAAGCSTNGNTREVRELKENVCSSAPEGTKFNLSNRKTLGATVVTFDSYYQCTAEFVLKQGRYADTDVGGVIRWKDLKNPIEEAICKADEEGHYVYSKMIADFTCFQCRNKEARIIDCKDMTLPDYDQKQINEGNSSSSSQNDNEDEASARVRPRTRAQH